ncbi:hypothetical protein C8F04DRAFT_1173338 [Mycena alexandri]|uniref:Uncharacterized protein n=1 Tax=Mycena alexandri TaxID=1745969 RepID=A0AAD6TJE2_9AGAR|nr:hypothetical protein C8F04DRAFT_1173338 [Mycena alexandri]
MEEDESESPNAVAIAAALRDAGVDELGRVDASSASSSAKQAGVKEEEKAEAKLGKAEEGELTESQLSRLTHVLERSALYSNDNSTTGKGKGGRGKETAKRRRADDEEDTNTKQESGPEEASASAPGFPQRKLITGATLHPYQLEGLQWMLGLDEQGISGILVKSGDGAASLLSSFFFVREREQRYPPMRCTPHFCLLLFVVPDTRRTSHGARAGVGSLCLARGCPTRAAFAVGGARSASDSNGEAVVFGARAGTSVHSRDARHPPGAHERRVHPDAHGPHNGQSQSKCSYPAVNQR